MAYEKRCEVATLFQGTSFTQSLGHDDKTIWGVDERLNYIMTNENNESVSSADLIRSDDDLSFTFEVPEGDTVDLEGEYLLIVYQTNVNNININVPVAQYEITYTTTKAT